MRRRTRARRRTALPKTDGKDKETEESFTPVSFSRDAAKLLVTSRKGWYIVTVADAARQLILPLDDDEDKNPRVAAIDWSSGRHGASTPRGARATPGSAAIVRIDVATRTDVDDRQGRPGLRRRPPVARRQHVHLHACPTAIARRICMPPTLPSPSVTRLSDANPGWRRSRCRTPSWSTYRDVDGKQLYGVVRYPDRLRERTHLPDGVRDLRDVLRQRFQRPRRVPRRTTATSSFIRRSTSSSAGQARPGSRA